MELILIRHTTIQNPDNLCYGQTEMELGDDFQASSLKLLDSCKDFMPDAIFSSPSLRCTRLAASFMQPYHIDSRLAELDFGVWEGRSWDSLEPEGLQYWMDNYVSRPVPGGESYLDLSSRVLGLIAFIKEKSLEKVILITHSGPVRAILACFLEISLYNSFELPVPYGAVFRLSLHEGLCNSVKFPGPSI